MIRTKTALALAASMLAAATMLTDGSSSLRGRYFQVLAQAQQPYDLVIRNGRVIDGTGSPWYRADVAVRGDTIALMAPSIAGPAAAVVDANGVAALREQLDDFWGQALGSFRNVVERSKRGKT